MDHILSSDVWSMPQTACYRPIISSAHWLSFSLLLRDKVLDIFLDCSYRPVPACFAMFSAQCFHLGDDAALASEYQALLERIDTAPVSFSAEFVLQDLLKHAESVFCNIAGALDVLPVESFSPLPLPDYWILNLPPQINISFEQLSRLSSTINK